MRTTALFNDGWLFVPEYAGDNVPDSAFEAVTLPHSNRLLPHNGFDDAEYQIISTYRKRFRLPQARAGRRLFLDFDGAMIAATVTLNGHTFDEHKGGYTPFSFDITDYVKDTGENVLTVHLDSTERKDIPPFGYVVDYLAFGGIYRDVHLRYVEPCSIADVFIKTHGISSDSPSVEFEVTLRNASDTPQAVVVVGNLEFWRDEMATVEVPPRSDLRVTLHSDMAEFPRSAFRLWSLDDPKLYLFTVRLYAQTGFNGPDEVQLDEVTVRSGFREARFLPNGFYLNGEQVKLIGLNRHQTYPYFGAAAPARLQRKDADIIKYELGCNIVRTSHYPQARAFIERCDEIGLLVFEEIPGWQHIGDADWQALSLRDVRVMIERDRSHPSIILWGVRINESLDDTAFYTATNALARELDPTRQTGGVRFFMGSEFLEDVFTFNDFSNTILEPENVPHLVTEFNGHMFPTKTWDSEERLLEHALRHARIQSRQLTMGGVAGAIGWCAFDYNTHKEFGSGDRVCYHGVMDMFRLPKYAAHFYASQIAPSQRVVLEAATVWSMGDRSGGGNDPLVVFSNCDEIDVYVGQELHGRFKPDAASFPGLKHPPFQVTGLWMRWGDAFGDLRVVGCLNGEAVAEQCIAGDGLPAALTLAADDSELRADGMDMTRLAFKIVDRYGNRLPYINRPVTFEIPEGEALVDLIGENPFALVGGQAALYVRAKHTPGTVTVRASAPRLDPATVTITLR